MSKNHVLCVIPVRYQSTRLPGKPLLDIGGHPMIEWVYKRASQAKKVNEVLVATDDKRILKRVRDFGGHAVMTSPDCVSGTERIAEAALEHPADLVLNLQGDEPLIAPAAIDELVSVFEKEPQVKMATLMCKIAADEDEKNPDLVKVVTDTEGYALYFSRSPIPYKRDPGRRKQIYYHHYGIYAFHPDTLHKLVKFPVSPLEKAEQLEQLRALHHGIRIRVLETSHSCIGVNTIDDLDKVRQLVESDGKYF
jgi:3-deoxy-manno-octulosonate cytidylyltransferase (CMP-KDO synthetase)